ncbi:C39 family peptidase [Desulfuromonas carbonis]|uniref:C39 family peptidase n=1 Tax=Desulfuromonas sp. DDH964 TaxID=1823759 RepID=UPI00078C726A|nr:C39 family peptidase [Desulfuromonas sp. DDH964]AMV70808.1 hypothetical protein DBW_0406 [Desulfuromonas sp. DDH964]
MEANLPERAQLPFEILPQPDEITCGPTCLHALYNYYGDSLPLQQVIAEVPMLEGGGTLAVLLACHALRRGYRATIYTYKLQLFDPTWLTGPPAELPAKLRAQMAVKDDPRLHAASRAYLDFLALGGELRFEDLTTGLIRKFLNRGAPVISGLSATYLYHSPREFGPNADYDDIRGEPSGHFVVLRGYDRQQRTVLIADPLASNPVGAGQRYEVSIDRVICAILLGVLTYDANLLIIRPPGPKGRSDADSHRR